MALTKVSSGLMKPDNNLELEYTSQLGTTSVVGAATGYVVRTNYYDANVTAGSGATFKFTGVTTLGKAGNVPDADGYFYDAVGRQFELTGPRYFLEHWGVAIDGIDGDATNNIARAQGAVDYMYAKGGGKIEAQRHAHIKINLGLIILDNIEVDLHGALLENINAAPVDISDNEVVIIGSMHPLDDNDHAWEKCDATTIGQQFVDLSGGVSADYEVGDMVLIVEPQLTFGSGAGDIPTFGQFNEIVRISGSNLYLKYTLQKTIVAGTGVLGVNPTGVWVANVSYRVSASKGTGIRGTRHTAKRVVFRNAKVKSAAGAWWGRSSLFEGLIENIEILENAYGYLGNALSYSILRNFKGVWYTRGVELKYLSHHTLITDFNISKSSEVTDTSGGEETVVSIGENARSCSFINSVVGVGDHTTANLIKYPSVTDCVIDNVFFHGGANITSGHIGLSDQSRQCRVSNSTFACGNAPVLIEMNGTDCIVENNRFKDDGTLYALRAGSSDLDGAIVRGNVFEQEGLLKLISGVNCRIYDNIGISGTEGSSLLKNHIMYNNTNEGRQAIKAVNANETVTSSTSSLTLAELSSVTYPLGKMSVGDVITTRVSGQCTGSAGARTFEAHLISGGTNITALSGALTSTDSQWAADIAIELTGLTKARITATFFVNGDVIDGTYVTNTINNVTTTDLQLSLQGLVANAADTISTVSIRRKYWTNGFLAV